MFSRSDLAAMTGEKNGPVHLAVLGKVYDVTKGRKHYGPGGGYSFFAGEYAVFRTLLNVQAATRHAHMSRAIFHQPVSPTM